MRRRAGVPGVCVAVLAWAVVCSLLATVSAAGPASAASQVSEGAVDSSGARLLAGATRYETAVVLAQRATEMGGGAGGVVVVSGESLVDALSAVPLAAARSGVVVLTQTAELPDVVTEFISMHGVAGVSVVGGGAAVSSEVATRLRELIGGDAVERFAGADRYETGVAVARAAGAPGGWCGEPGPAVLLVNGTSLVDGVLAAPVAFAMGLPVLFTRAAALPEVVRGYLADAGVERAVVIGGDAEISPAVVGELAELNVEVTLIDGVSRAARSVALAEAARACGAASDEFALLDANMPIDGVAAAALLARGVQPTAKNQSSGAASLTRLVPVLAVDRDLPAEVAKHLSIRGDVADDVTLYALGGTARITPQLMRDALDAVERSDTSAGGASGGHTPSDASGDVRDSEPTRSRPAASSRTRSGSDARAGVALRAAASSRGTSTSTTGASSTTSSTTTTSEAPLLTTTTEPPSPASTSTTSSTSSTTSSSTSSTTTTSEAPLLTTTTEPPATTSRTTASEAPLLTTTTEPPPPLPTTTSTVPVQPTTTTEAPVQVPLPGTTSTTSSTSSTTSSSTSSTTSSSTSTTTTTDAPATTSTTEPPVPLPTTASAEPSPPTSTTSSSSTSSTTTTTETPVQVPLPGTTSTTSSTSTTTTELSASLSISTTTSMTEPPQPSSTTVPGVFGGVAAGLGHSCGLQTDGSVVCWGVLRLGSVPSGMLVEIANGDRHVCGLRADGSVVCWGDDEFGQLDVPVGSFVGVAAGAGFSCGLSAAGQISCWGRSSRGQLDVPDGSFNAVVAGHAHACGLRIDDSVACWGDVGGVWHPRDAFARVTPGVSFDALTAGSSHGCGVRSDGAVLCWGHNDHRQLDAPAGSFVEVAAGDAHTCGLQAGGAVVCWGDNSLGQRGAPVGSFRSISAGYDHSCGVRVDGEIVCWGDDVFGQLGEDSMLGVTASSSTAQPTMTSSPSTSTSTTLPSSSAPSTSTTLPSSRFIGVAAGYDHSCAWRASGPAVCWGDDEARRRASPSGSFVSVSDGMRHACGLRADGSVSCWGARILGQLAVPAGRFTQVSAGFHHSCGVLVDQSVACWGDDAQGQSDAPSGTFWAVDGGFWHTCGLRTDDTIACWGWANRGTTDPPSGTFTAVSAGRYHNCALRIDDRVLCWGGLNGDGELDAPTGAFRAVSAGSDFSCALTLDEAITCWGNNDHGQTDTPDGSFASVAAGHDHACGIRVDSVIVCWGDDTYGERDASSTTPTSTPSTDESAFVAISAGRERTCALRADGTFACWHRHEDATFTSSASKFAWRTDTGTVGAAVKAIGVGEVFYCWLRANSRVDCTLNYVPPNGPFEAVAVGGAHACGLRPSAVVACWGNNDEGQLGAPTGTFTAVSAGEAHTCGVRSDETIACWGDNGYGQADAPAGSFAVVSAGRRHTCALAPNGDVLCWGDDSYGQVDVPAGSFAAVSAGRRHTCGLLVDQSVVCWGDDSYGQLEVPAGSFTAVAAGGAHACGLRGDGSIDCWGDRGAVPLVDVSWSTGIFRCRPQGPEGFRWRRDIAVANTSIRDGVLDVLVVFGEFGDARHDREDYATQWPTVMRYLGDAVRYIEAQSYGQLDVRLTVVPEWITISESRDDDLDVSGLGDTPVPLALAQAGRIVDITNDGDGFDSLLLTTPPQHFSGAHVSWPFDQRYSRWSPPTYPLPAALVGDTASATPTGGALDALTAAHELLHTINLNDLYYLGGHYESGPRPERATQTRSGGFGIMGFIHNQWAADVTRSLGTGEATGTAYPALGAPVANASLVLHPSFTAEEMIGWSRWRLGWLDESQVACVDPGATTVDLAPVATPGSSTALAMIPISPTQMLVLEARRREGYDADVFERWRNGDEWAERYRRRVPYEGVFAYTVNPSIRTGSLPIRILGDSWGYAHHSPILTAGETARLDGGDDGPVIDVSVVSDDGDFFRVDVDWVAAADTTADRYDLTVTRPTASDPEPPSADAGSPGASG